MVELVPTHATLPERTSGVQCIANLKLALLVAVRAARRMCHNPLLPVQYPLKALVLWNEVQVVMRHGLSGCGGGVGRRETITRSLVT